MATLTVVPLSLANPVDDTGMVQANSGDVFPNDGLTFLYFKNTSGGSITVTMINSVSTVTPSGYGTISYTNTAIAVANNTSNLIGPFGPSRFNTAIGQTSYNLSGSSASFTVKAIRFTPVA